MAKGPGVYKYKHGQGGSWSGWRLWLCLGLGAVIALGVIVLPFLAVFGVVALILVIVLTRAKPTLMIGSRYLLCGQQVVYYRQVARAEVDRHRGVLRLHLPGGRSWVMEMERFPTNARKTDKIRINKAKKFGNLSSKIIGKLQKANPNIEIHEVHG